MSPTSNCTFSSRFPCSQADNSRCSLCVSCCRDCCLHSDLQSSSPCDALPPLEASDQQHGGSNSSLLLRPCALLSPSSVDMSFKCLSGSRHSPSTASLHHDIVAGVACFCWRSERVWFRSACAPRLCTIMVSASRWPASSARCLRSMPHTTSSVGSNFPWSCPDLSTGCSVTIACGMQPVGEGHRRGSSGSARASSAHISGFERPSASPWWWWCCCCCCCCSCCCFCMPLSDACARLLLVLEC